MAGVTISTIWQARAAAVTVIGGKARCAVIPPFKM